MLCVPDRLAFRRGVLVSCFAVATIGVNAVEIGYFTPGVPSIRDFVMPKPGFYGVLYNYRYSTDRLNDSGRNEINSVTINPGPGGGVTREVRANADVYAISPVLIRVSPWKPVGGKASPPLLAIPVSRVLFLHKREHAGALRNHSKHLPNHYYETNIPDCSCPGCDQPGTPGARRRAGGSPN
jgi:hypothetical protein